MRPWRGAAYRVTTLEYPSPKSILLGQGSYLYGGRWNAIGSFRVVYGSTTDVVAVAESRANAEYAGISLPFRTPRLLVTVDLVLARVIDLTIPETMRRLFPGRQNQGAEDWRRMQNRGEESESQAFGRACFEHGANGLIASSARVLDGINVMYFPENCSDPAEAKVYEAEKLDRIRGEDA